jgi:hypothetical protein
MGGGRGGNSEGGGGRNQRDAGNTSPRTVASAPGGTTIDSLFGPLPPVDRPGTVWLYVGGQLKAVRVRVGIQDGAFTELLSGELQPNTDVVTGVITPAEQRNPTSSGQSPLMGPQRGPGRGGPGGGPGGGGGNRGGGRG